MRLKIQLLIISFGLFGCQVPKKPVINICDLDLPREEGVCALTVKAPEVTRIPIEDMDKYRCLSQEDWEKQKNYMDQMRAILERADDHR